MKVVSIIFLSLVLSCSNKNDKQIMAPEKMEVVLYDLMRADEFALNFIKLDSTQTLKGESVKLYDEVFALHKTNQKEFNKSLNYYKNNPKLLQPIFDSLEQRLNRNKNFIPPVIEDSAIKANLPK